MNLELGHGTVKVVVRNSSDDECAESFLGHFLPHQLEDLVKSFQQNDVYESDSGDVLECDSVSGQYVIKKGYVFFEIVV